VEEYDDTRFLTMEIVDGRTIDRLIPSAGPPLEQLLGYAIPLVEAIVAAHAHQLVHRDLKPANVMVTGDGRATTAFSRCGRSRHRKTSGSSA
jgi:serine/threonine protein kinase